MDKFIEYWRSIEASEKDGFAASVGTTKGYINKAISIRQIFGAALCVRIERETGGEVTRKDLRSDWREIWPELILKRFTPNKLSS